MNESENNKGLTIERLRKLKNFDNISQEQAVEIVNSIKMMAALCYEHINNVKKETSAELNKKNLALNKKETNTGKESRK